MSETPPIEEPSTPARPANTKRNVILVVTVIVIAAFAWALLSKAFAVRAAEQEGAKNAASALASSAVPLLDLRSKNLLGDPETLQRVVDDVASNRNRFSFAGILDAQGKVIVASDRATAAGSDYPGFENGEVVEKFRDGKYEVISPVEQGSVVYGAVVLRLN